MRKTPSEKSEVVSQALFGEKVFVSETAGAWSLIQTPDQYLGWVISDSFVSISTYLPSYFVSRLSAHVYEEKEVFSPIIQTLPFGVGVMALEDSDPFWIRVQMPNGSLGYIQNGNLSKDLRMERDEMISFSLRFLGLPYTWGGRSSFGYDCSGFIQMLYSRIGIDLARDSSLQDRDPRFRKIDEEPLIQGDLIFWGLNPEKIKHVGMYLGNGEMIHASAKENKPWLRISSLTDFVWSGQDGAPYPYRAFKRLSV